jgi:ankyrin repeat protein
LRSIACGWAFDLGRDEGERCEAYAAVRVDYWMQRGEPPKDITGGGSPLLQQALPNNAVVFQLHKAVEDGQLALLDALLSGNGIDIDERNSDGCTALYMAAKKGDLQMVEYLWRKGADSHAHFGQ